MANANTNLLSITTANRQTNVNATSRTQNSVSSRSNDTNYHSNSTRKSKGDFSSELDKANAQANQPQQSEEAQVAAESAQSTSVDELANASTHGKKEVKQDAPKNSNQLLSDEKNVQAVTQNVAENLVTEIIPTDTAPTINAETPLEIPQDNIQPVDTEFAGKNINQQVTIQPAFNPVQTPAEPADDISEINLNDIPAQIENNVADAVLDVADTLPAQAMSADMAFYFTASNESLLTAKEIPAEVDTTNLMSIMPQARDTKAQSMLDFLSGKTWQSTQTEKDIPQNLNLQNLFAQSDQASTVQPVQIQPQYQPRVIDIQTAVQPTLQAQTLMTNQPLQVQPLQENIQPVIQNQAPVQIQSDFQPVITNQAPIQVQPQENIQPVIQNQAPVQIQSDFQPVITNQAPIQVQPQPQENIQPVIQNQAPVQVQQQNNFQPTLNQAPVQMQNDFQPVITNQAPVQVQPQNNFQPVITNQPTLQVQPQENIQPLVTNQPTLQTTQENFQPVIQNQAPVQVQPLQENIQPLTLNQPTLQTQPQFQQQQFGAEIQPQINSLQPQLDSKTVNRQVVEDILGVNLQVDDTRQATQPLMPLQNFSRQFNQNQQSAQNFQQNFAPMTAQVETQVAEQMPQGVENFAGNIAALNNTQSQPTAQVQAPEVMQAPREDFNIPTQIVEQARMIRTNTNTEMVIQLKPEHLGELTLRVSVSTNGAVTASFYSDNAQVRAIIENSIVHLRQELNEQGIKVDNVEVYAGLSEEGLLNGQGQQAWQQNQQQRNNRGTVDYDAAAEEEVETLNPTADNLSADGVDYKV